MLKEFRNFAMRGNVVDMAVGIIIGSAFGAIVNSLVRDVLMPPVGFLLGGVDFSNFFLVLDAGQGNPPFPTLEAAREAGAVTLNYGLFINSLITFLIIAFSVFLLIRAINRLQPAEETAAAEPATKECPYCALPIPIQARRCPHCTSRLA
jgi:large conductance mechanosensitive channel